MDILLILLVIGMGIVNMFVLRFFVKTLYEKLEKLYEKENPSETRAPFTPIDFTTSSGTGSTAVRNISDRFDKPAKNTVMDTDENEVDLNEDTPMAVPPDVKFEVEGGDSIVPPGYTAKPN